MVLLCVIFALNQLNCMVQMQSDPENCFPFIRVYPALILNVATRDKLIHLFYYLLIFHAFLPVVGERTLYFSNPLLQCTHYFRGNQHTVTNGKSKST